MPKEIGLCLLSTADASIVWANVGAAELFGYSRKEMCQLAMPVGSQDSNSTVPTFGPVAEAFQTIVNGNAEEMEGTARFRDKKQRRITLQWKLWRLGQQDNPGQILLSLAEVAALSELGPAKYAYERDFDNADEAIFRCSMDGTSMEVNAALANLMGYKDPKYITGKVASILGQLFVNSQRKAEFVNLLNTKGFVAGFEAELWRADRSIMWTALFARAVQPQEGKPLYLESRVVDVTARKRAETALRRSEERFRKLVETTRVIPFEIDLAGKQFSYLGPQAQALIARTLCSGCSLADWVSILHPEDIEEGTRFFRETGTTASETQREFRVHAATGDTIWIKQIVDSPNILEDSGHVRGFFLDVTEAKDLEVDREHAKLKLRQLAAQSHSVREEERMIIAREIHDELGQALTLLKIGLSWLGKRLEKTVEEEVRRPMETRIGEMERMLDSTLETVRRILSALRPPLLDDLGLKAAMEFHLSEFSKRVGIRYDLQIQDLSDPPVSEATAMFRIFQEILTNVARHAKASRITVKASQSPSHMTLTVEDNGKGISPDDVRELKHFGILGMQERAWAIGGELEIYRRSEGGTRVTLKVALTCEMSSNAREKERDRKATLDAQASSALHSVTKAP